MTHKRILVAVEASSEEDAKTMVTYNLHNYLPSSFDYFVIGGRWEGDFDGKNVISFKKKPELFKSELKRTYDLQTRQMRKNFGFLNNKPISQSLDPVEETEEDRKVVLPHTIPTHRDQYDFHESMKFHYIKKILDLADGEFCTDSYFYDMEYGHALIFKVEERIKDKKIANKQYLVLVDGHH